MPTVVTVLIDDANLTRTETTVTDAAGKFISRTTQDVAKPGSPLFNLQALQTRSLQAIADCNTAEALLNASGWDGLTVAQRKAIMTGVVQALRAQARLNLNQYDAPS